MSEGRHHFRLKGELAENVVHDLAEASFFTDWCYRNPKLSDGKELCDLLVVFEDVAIIWQIKDLKLQEDGRFSEKHVAKNLRQLSGAKRRLLDESRPIVLSNPHRGKETFDPKSVARIYLISALTGPGEDFFPFFRDIKNGTAHVFDAGFLDVALQELDTVADFVAYLDAKETFLSGDIGLILNGGEQELLATYLTNDRSFDDFVDATFVVVDEGSWAEFQKRPEYLARREADEVSYAWDELIEQAHASGSPDYERIARALARPNRFNRRILAKAFYDAHVLAHENHEENIFRRVLPQEGVTFCFLFAGRDVPIDERRAGLELFCFVARGTIPENQLVLGIATEQRFESGASYDFCLLEMPQWTARDEADMKTIQAETGILMRAVRREVHEEEYPTQA